MPTATDKRQSSLTTPAPAPIKIYSTLGRAKEPLIPVMPGKIGMYLCGPTVYKPSHIGHLVGPVIFDAIKRYLVYSGYDVTWVVNITDIDDKLINEARDRGITITQLAEEMTADYMQNLDAMGIDTIDHFPRATENIDEIVRLTQNLIDRGFAYESDGDVYFEVSKDRDYGKLSRRTPESMQGEGGEMRERKRSSADFALWKSAKPGEPAWDSPWGRGRPGWHIECSAMSRRLLGETFDIHGGGLDLIFPHHENEIAQSECSHGKPQAKYWMHNGLLQAASEVGKLGGRNTRAAGEMDQAAQAAGKISKSKGALPFSELLKNHSPETIRLLLISTHYRSPIFYSEDRLQELAGSLETFYRFFQRFERVTGQNFYELETPARRRDSKFDDGSIPLLIDVAKKRETFFEAMDDDFNTGVAVAQLFELVRALNRFADDAKLETADKKDHASLAAFVEGVRSLRELSLILGLFRKPMASNRGNDEPLLGGLMELLIELRNEARKKKDFATADQIRNGLTELGVTLEDRKDGTTWTRT